MLDLSVTHRRLLQRLLLLLVTVGMLSLWILGINRTESLGVSDVQVNIDKEEGIRDLITVDDVTFMIEKGLPNDISVQSLRDIDITMIEEMLLSDSRIYTAEVYMDAHQVLKVDIVQRRPVLRVMNKQGDQYYLDQIGTYVAQADFRAVRVPVVTGYVESLQPMESILPDQKLSIAFDIVMRIRKDEFLSALVEQITFEKNDRIILIPKVGNEKIILDHIDDLDSKLKNLKDYYKEVAKSNSWDKYDEIDISYRKQVVGRRNPVTP